MATVVTTSSYLPFQLQPEIHLGDARPAVDIRARYAQLYETLYRPFPLPDTLRQAGPPALLTLKAANDLAAGMQSSIARDLRGAGEQLLEVFAPHLPPPLGEGSRFEVTCLHTDQAGYPAGTVVVVRTTDQLTEQYVLSHVHVDLEDGTRRLVNMPTRRAPTVVRVAEPVRRTMSFFLSVSPFLPAPWGAITTGGLTLANMLMEMGDDTPAPHVELRKQLETVVITDDIRQQQGVLTEVSDHFTNMTASLTMKIEEITTTDGSIDALATYVDTEGLPKVRTANGQLWSLLQTRNVDDCDSALAMLVRGVSLGLLLETYSVQIEALRASVAKSNGKLQKFNDGANRWTFHVSTIAKDVGEKPTDPWTAETMKAQMESTAWIPKIEAWMAKAKSDRLGMISSDTYRIDTSCGIEHILGWTWRDSHYTGPSDCPRWVGPDGGELANVARDTVSSADCCGSIVQHKDQADEALAAHRNSVSAAIDAAFASAAGTVDSWTTVIASLHELLPPSTPTKAPTVGAKSGGAATPQPPDWVSGSAVRYAVAAVNAKGPSPNGPWSSELKVGSTAFATLTGFPVSATQDALWLYRQVRRPGEDWGDMALVTILPIPLPSSYDDTDAGQ
jgi:hypothetical protein